MTDKTVSLPQERRHAGFIKNNLRTYGMLLSLFAIMLFNVKTFILGLAALSSIPEGLGRAIPRSTVNAVACK